MSDKSRPEIALSVYLNEQLLGVFSLDLPKEQSAEPLEPNNVGAESSTTEEVKPISLVSDPTVIDPLRLVALKKLELTIAVEAQSGSRQAQTFAFDGEKLRLLHSWTREPMLRTTTFVYDSALTRITRSDSMTIYHYEQSPEPPELPVDPPTIIE